MSLATSVIAIVGLDALVLGLLAYVLRMPFRLAPAPATVAACSPAPQRPAVARTGSNQRSGDALARARRVLVVTVD